MARTKQTPKKSTGGRALRVNPGIGSLPPPQGLHSHDGGGEQYCYMCLNGGHLVICDRCSRALCNKCIAIPPTIESFEQLKFLCLHCHSQAFKGPMLQPYYGFYIHKGLELVDEKLNPNSLKPALPSHLTVVGNFQMTAASHVSNEGLTVLHFILRGLDSAGSPAVILVEYMRAYLESSLLFYEEIIFDLGDDTGIKAHVAKMQSLSDRIKHTHPHILIFVTNHSHEDTGDLFLAPTLCGSVKHVLNLLLPSQYTSFLKERDTTLWMMSCGALVRNASSYAELAEITKQLSVLNVVAFTAAELQPCLTVGFIIGYAQQVLVEKFALEDCFRRLLPTTSAICRHTDIVHIRTVNGQVRGNCYTWVHPDLRPWGHQLPVQCSRCGCIRAWVSASGPELSRLFACGNPKCSNTLVFNAPEARVWLGPEILGGRWLLTQRD